MKLLDFGLVKLVAHAEPFLTMPGTTLGTIRYLSPEQALGQAVTAKSDIYSLACVLYEAIAGVPPFQADNTLALMEKQVGETPAQIGDQKLDEVLSVAMAKDESRRYADVIEFKEALLLLKYDA